MYLAALSLVRCGILFAADLAATRSMNHSPDLPCFKAKQPKFTRSALQHSVSTTILRVCLVVKRGSRHSLGLKSRAWCNHSSGLPCCNVLRVWFAATILRVCFVAKRGSKHSLGLKARAWWQPCWVLPRSKVLRACLAATLLPAYLTAKLGGNHFPEQQWRHI